MIVADDGDNEDGGDGGYEKDGGRGGFSGRRPAGEQEPPGVAGLPCSIWMVVSIAEFLYDRDADQNGEVIVEDDDDQGGERRKMKKTSTW